MDTLEIVYAYPVKRPFTYNGVMLKAGDMWQPQGFRNDGSIMEYYVDKNRATAVQGKQGKRKKAEAS